jgi:hypothetical protein
MSAEKKKPSPEEIVRGILEMDDGRDDEADVAAMTKEEVALELKAAGVDMDEMRRRTERELDMLRAKGAPAPVVPLTRRRALRWSLLAAALVAAALAAMPAIEMLASHTEPSAPRDKARREVELVNPDEPSRQLPTLAPGDTSQDAARAP